tara:strand:- start:50 stop:376 length:327 start_codon:yes stop_codon:yes gene_type:complete
MTQLYWKGPKVSEDEIRKELMRVLPDITESMFTVNIESDCNGQHVCCIVENSLNEPDKDPYIEGHWQKVPPKFLGWRVLKKTVPYGYISVFFKDKLPDVVDDIYKLAK